MKPMNSYAALSALMIWGIGIGAAFAQDSPGQAPVKPAAAPKSASSVARFITPDLPAFNRVVLELAAAYPTDGTHDYWWPRGGEGGGYDGVSRDLFLNGVKVMDGEPQKRTFCCGLTLEVFLEAYKVYTEKNGADSLAPVTPDKWGDFQRVWFVEKANGPGPSAAIVKYGLGKEIPANDAVAGDFVQIWRTKNRKGNASGHSVIFLEWVKGEEDNIIGMRYWSTQPGTKGINERIEYFGPFGGVSTEYTFYGRVEPKAEAEKKG